MSRRTIATHMADGPLSRLAITLQGVGRVWALSGKSPSTLAKEVVVGTSLGAERLMLAGSM